ncbi:hypothetical protein BJX65DRAFT_157348 [Aspergillus insuetus]
MDHRQPMSSNMSSQAAGVKGSQSGNEALIFIPRAIDQLQMDPVSLMSLSQTFHILPIPEDGDDLETTVGKVSCLAQVVDQGDSLALWTGMKLAPKELQDAESIATLQMTIEERHIYEAWKEWATARKSKYPATTTPTTVAGNSSTISQGASTSQGWFRLPDFNWDWNVCSVPEGAQSLKKFTQRAAAMDIVFGHQGATPENTVWLTYNMALLLPLVKAVTKISNMERHFQENRSKNASLQGLSEMEIAEMETARRVVAAAERNLNRESERLRRMTRELSKSNDVIRARMHEFKFQDCS